MWTSEEVAVNGIKLHYCRTGGDGPPVVLSHGITDNGLCWTDLAQALEGEYDVVMYDARGHGLSDAPEEAYSYAELAADLVGLIRALELERPVLIGHSMGASTTAVVAAGSPELVRGAVLEDPPWRDDAFGASREEQTARMAEWRADILKRRDQNLDEVIAQCRADNPDWPEADYAPWAESKQQVSPNVVNVLMAPSTPWRETAAQITRPVLLITGDPEKGAIVTPETAQEAERLLRNGRVAHIGGAGHCVRRQQRERYLETIQAFLAELEGVK